MLEIQSRVLLLELLNFSSHRNIKLYVVGGTLRDHILRKNISDVDLTGENIAELGAAFAKSLNFNNIPLDKTPGRSTTRIILPNKKHWDCTDMQGSKIEEDLSKRDFTMNAMGQELSDFLGGRRNIIDLFEGREDLYNKIVRATPGNVFEADPLRMLRAFRFSTTLGFTIDPGTLEEISVHKEGILKTAGERIWQEFLEFLKPANTGNVINLMKEAGLLSCLLPNSTLQWGKTLTHYKRLEHILENATIYFPDQTKLIQLSDKERALLKLSVLLKETHSSSITDPENHGSPEVFNFLKTLKASNNEINFICKSIQNSISFTELKLGNLSDSVLYDFSKSCGDQLIPGMLLQICTSPFPNKIDHDKNDILDHFSKVLEFYCNRYLPVLGEKALLDGNDIMRVLNINPSPVLGGILDEIRRAQVLGCINTPEEAEALAASILKSHIQNGTNVHSIPKFKME